MVVELREDYGLLGRLADQSSGKSDFRGYDVIAGYTSRVNGRRSGSQGRSPISPVLGHSKTVAYSTFIVLRAVS